MNVRRKVISKLEFASSVIETFKMTSDSQSCHSQRMSTKSKSSLRILGQREVLTSLKICKVVLNSHYFKIGLKRPQKELFSSLMHLVMVKNIIV